MIEDFVYTSTAAIQRIIPTSSNPYPPTSFYGFFLVKTRPWIFITDLQTLLHSTGIVKPSGFGTSSWIGHPFHMDLDCYPYGLPFPGFRKFQPLDLLFSTDISCLAFSLFRCVSRTNRPRSINRPCPSK
ncbi:hypothetical protein EYC84_008335 [Monilinia fructicola]|uniref:Uncharacterized protein n=1 Tax=Monilinia fructicola TaxID=38448 RepID=A0A5M9JE79_MONFR|nr:hypothetical protein EYC84_008335 [Monilinia fructicola]